MFFYLPFYATVIPRQLTAEPWCSALSLFHWELADSIWCNLLMEGGRECIKIVCVRVHARSMRILCALRTPSFHGTLAAALVCVDRGTGRFIGAARRGSFCRHITLAAHKINTLQYLREPRLTALY